MGYLYLKILKELFFLLCLAFSSTNLENKRAEQVLPGNEVGVGGSNNIQTCK
jgi:hypothetical protein